VERGVRGVVGLGASDRKCLFPHSGAQSLPLVPFLSTCLCVCVCVCVSIRICMYIHVQAAARKVSVYPSIHLYPGLLICLFIFISYLPLYLHCLAEKGLN
jgi:hypothetical protein